MELGSRSGRFVVEGGVRFKDLDGDGRVAPYEDWRRSPEERARDLLGRMTLLEKAGVLMHGTIPIRKGEEGERYDRLRARRMIVERGVNSFITRLTAEPRVLAAENNALQELAEGTRWGIPATVSTDPRHHFQDMPGASVVSNGFSRWPETLGFAALGDAERCRRFADIARREYRAVGIHVALSPQADLATEPRWSRIHATFGEDAERARTLVRAYIEGFQNGSGGIGPDSVVCVVKHWVGYGAAKDGFDSHNAYGRHAVFPGGHFEYHLRPFEGAFAARVGGVMPTYSILEGVTLEGEPLEPVGAGFSRQLLTGLLRGRYGFDGVILSDWAITNDADEACLKGAPEGQAPSFVGFGTPWGVETLSQVERFAKGLHAGLDQFGGVDDPQPLLDAVQAGLVTEARLDESVYRVLLQKFQQGLFENPYVDVEQAGRVVGQAAFLDEARDTQRRALVLLENKDGLLPLGARHPKVYLHGIEGAVAVRYGLTVVPTLEEADVALLRVAAPFQTLHPQYVFGLRQHEGRLDFAEDSTALEAIRRAAAKVPTVVTVSLDRPAILTNVKDRVTALLGDFGVEDAALLEVLLGRASPEGRLPFELPSSMAEVEAARSDMPHDTAHPLYPLFFGRSY